MTDSATQALHVEIVPAARDEQAIVENLLQLYAHDFSESHDIELGPDGRFGYKPLPLYWSEPERHPFLVRTDGKLAGFALVKKGSEVSRDLDVWDIAEVFVIRRFRRRRVGIQAAHKIWRQFPGAWEVRVMEANTAASRFWECAISKFSGEAASPSCFEKDGELWKLFSFRSEGDAF